MKRVGWLWRSAAVIAVCVVAAIGCTGGTRTPDEQAILDQQPVETPTPRAGPNDPKPDPVPFVPNGQVGDTDAYAERIAQLRATIPAELRDDVPWPDLLNPDPIAVQLDVFALWIWMDEHNPDPGLVDIMAASGSPIRPGIEAGFAELFGAGWLDFRPDAPYRAYDHQAITFESAGLPLWLARDVPEDAVVIYYTDESGPIETRDRDTGANIHTSPPSPPREWVSIWVETDVGWLLWIDQLITAGDSELETPNRVPSPEVGQPRPEV